ncbi:bifunctional hydroxymethylpyrimidine kinase/phosphomethylpyrimidine kinase [Candidiatus Paracoxiella cheracis]|uniref:bifunctional hydroxymethylpyrimidine kinase/phosphomethylpyrimidine kinase n=1 Tax=Candidiatus Paracoxiella cheracis TaxID=3405120 RepID=UPI003BF60556
MTKPIVWTIAGSDSGGGAGIQADLHTFQALGAHGCSVITAITAQNTQQVHNISPVSLNNIRSQVHALDTDLPATAIKLGMLYTPEIVQAVADYLKDYNGVVICDPVMISTSGTELLTPQAKQLLIDHIFPRADLVTPNRMEAELILKNPIQNHADVEKAAKHILKLGPKSVLIKGGHSSDNTCYDYWTNGHESFWLCSPKQPTQNTHGSGCTLASAITACLALGYDIKDALVIAKMYINQGIDKSESLGRGPGHVMPSSWPEKQHYLPKVIHHITSIPHYDFPKCHEIGLYPIIDNIDLLKKLLSLGISTIQLRIKNKTFNLDDDIKQAIKLAKHYDAKLFINDYWELAIKHNAYGVHLGQSDIEAADIHKIHAAGLHLGISTHCYYEVARAHALNPSYLACGPIFPTTTKIMPFKPQGIEGLARWRRTLDYPLVAIGGIDFEKYRSVMETGVNGVAMISAISMLTNCSNINSVNI